MRIYELVIGTVLLIGSVYGYSNSVTLVSEIQNYLPASLQGFFSGIPGSEQNSMLLHMNSPEMQTMIKIAHIGFIGIAVSSLALLGYGIVAKKKTSKIQNVEIHKINENSKPKLLTKNGINESSHTNPQALQILKERLAQGQITKTEFEKFKKLLSIDE